MNHFFRRFLMVPPCGFLFLRFCGSCALKCEIWCVCVFCVKIAPCKAPSVALNDAM